MKKVIFRFFCLCILTAALAGCKKDFDYASHIVGEWDLMNYEPAVKSVVIGDETVTIDIVFNSDGTFSMQQTVGQGRPVSFDGTYTVDGDLLSGVYSDKTKWGESYRMEFLDDDILILHTVSAAEAYTYRRK